MPSARRSADFVLPVPLGPTRLMINGILVRVAVRALNERAISDLLSCERPCWCAQAVDAAVPRPRGRGAVDLHALRPGLDSSSPSLLPDLAESPIGRGQVHRVWPIALAERE